MVHEDDNTTLK